MVKKDNKSSTESLRRSKVIHLILHLMSFMSTETAIFKFFLIPTGTLAKQNLRDRDDGGGDLE